ncbi:phage tail protein [Mycolicibacterium mucogenicum]|uniref:Phage tail protein n=1 Tax=Mycolicibacterium mucogenicum TaxID=56689 RepID=A0A1A3H139_MYCMU|nr:phage tail protein [Mycolicibacterium mucogenicum]OBJ41324.1 phage tail protein [Mycolicibacterium mucogenicum]
MAQNDEAVVIATQGFLFTAPPGTPAPTPDELEATTPETFGAQVLHVALSGTPDTFKLTVAAVSTPDLDADATPEAVQAALEALAGVGVGNVVVTAGDMDGYDVAVVGSKQGSTLTITGTATGGTTPSVTVSQLKAPNGWRPVGHTSADDLPEFGFDGGDPEVKRTWQNSALREVEGDPPADFVTVKLAQFDKNSLELYYGENASTTSGVFGVAGGKTPTNEKAFLVIIVDGPLKIGFYAPKASIRRDDSISLATDDFGTLPIKATFLKLPGRRMFDWIHKKLFA